MYNKPNQTSASMRKLGGGYLRWHTSYHDCLRYQNTEIHSDLWNLRKMKIEIRQIASSHCCFWHTSLNSLQLQNSVTRNSHTTSKSDCDMTWMEYKIRGGSECEQQQHLFNTRPVYLVIIFIWNQLFDNGEDSLKWTTRVVNAGTLHKSGTLTRACRHTN